MAIRKSLIIGFLAPMLLAKVAEAQNSWVNNDSGLQKINAAVSAHLVSGVNRYKPIAAGAVILDAKTGKLLVSVSTNSSSYKKLDLIKDGLYEFRQVAKISTIAAALEAKVVTLKSRIDARQPFKIGKYRIEDEYPQNRILTVQEASLYRSNIAIAKIGLKIGGNYQSLFHASIGLKDRIGDGSEPRFPKQVKQAIVTANLFGQGFEITPLHAVSAFATLTNPDGRVIRPGSSSSQSGVGLTILSGETTAEIAKILRKDVEIGASKVVDIRNLPVGAITATSKKVKDGVYLNDHVITSMIAVVPYYDPTHIFLTMFDEPQAAVGEAYKTAAWNSGKIMAQILEDEVVRNLLFK